MSLPWNIMTSTGATPGPRRGPLRIATLAIAVLAVLSCATAGWFGISWYRAAHDESLVVGMARDAALRDAQQAAVNLNTLDYRRVQDGLNLWEQSATGTVLQEVRTNRASYARTITDSKTTTTARSLDGAVADLNERAGTARVLVGVDVTSKPAQGDPTCLRWRMQLEMLRTDTAWKVDKLAPIGTSSPVPGACSVADPEAAPPN
jgi:Mce-associated membrane protein